MKFSFFILIIAFCNQAIAQQSKSDSSLIGTWKGTSICQIKSSPCHDEIAVYHISKTDRPDIYQMLMNKLVNNVEEEMGTLEYVFDLSKNTLTNRDEKRGLIWEFKMKNNTMEGTLLYKNVLYRIIKLTKESGH